MFEGIARCKACGKALRLINGQWHHISVPCYKPGSCEPDPRYLKTTKVGEAKTVAELIELLKSLDGGEQVSNSDSEPIAVCLFEAKGKKGVTFV